MAKLLFGSAGSGKTAHVLGELCASIEAGVDARLLVPTSSLAEHLSHEIARAGIVLRAKSVQTLHRFTAELAPDLTTAPAHWVPLLVGKVVRSKPRAEFARVAEMSGFHNRLARTIADLDAAGATPEALLRVGNAGQYRDAVSWVWYELNKLLKARGWMLRGAQLRAIVERMTGPPLLAPRVPERLWLDGFAQLSPPEMEFIGLLANRADVTVTLSDRGTPARLRDQFKLRAFEEIKLAGERSPKRSVATPENPAREAEEIARRILNAHERGIAFREMGVILRQPERYRLPLETTFERFGIPAVFHLSRALKDEPAARLGAALIEGVLSGWEHQATLRVLRAIPGFGASHVVDRFEAELLPELPGAGLASLHSLAHGRALKMRLEMLAKLHGHAEKKLHPAEWSEWVGGLPSRFLGHLDADPSTFERARFERVRELQSLAAGLNAFRSAVASAAEWSADHAAMSLTEFWVIARDVVAVCSLRPARGPREAVHVIGAHEARQWDLKFAAVPGMVEKQFPAVIGRDPFLPESALCALGARTASIREEEERLLWDSVQSRASDELLVTWPRTDERGQANLESIFVAADLTDPERLEARRVPSVRPAIADPIAPVLPVARFEAAHVARAGATALEKLMQCPYQFFAMHVLKVKDLAAAPEDRMDFLLQGGVVHAFLAAWRQGADFDAEFERIFSDQMTEARVQPGYRTELRKRRMKEDLRSFLESGRIALEPQAEVELSFEFELAPGLLLSGRFDRVERLPGRQAVVVDFKYSAAKSVKERVQSGTALQGALYSLAVREVLGLEPAAMVYASVKGPVRVIEGWGSIPGLELLPLTDEWMTARRSMVLAELAAFHSGAIAPKPREIAKCRYCDVRDACRMEEQEAAVSAGA